jgi:hypothetical protein
MKPPTTKSPLRSFVALLAVGAAAASGQACVPAAAAGAGAASAVYLTSRGAKAQVKGSTEEIEADSRKVLIADAVQITDEKIENGGKHRELKGKKGDLDVTISIDRRDDKTSEVEVTARKSAVTWDQDYARSILNSIVRES